MGHYGYSCIPRDPGLDSFVFLVNIWCHGGRVY